MFKAEREYLKLQESELIELIAEVNSKRAQHQAEVQALDAEMLKLCSAFESVVDRLYSKEAEVQGVLPLWGDLDSWIAPGREGDH